MRTFIYESDTIEACTDETQQERACASYKKPENMKIWPQKSGSPLNES